MIQTEDRGARGRRHADAGEEEHGRQIDSMTGAAPDADPSQ
jgi:hypothetical protein